MKFTVSTTFCVLLSFANDAFSLDALIKSIEPPQASLEGGRKSSHGDSTILRNLRGDFAEKAARPRKKIDNEEEDNLEALQEHFSTKDFVFTAGSNSSSSIHANIVGGDQSAVGEFPYYVDLGICGGTLIAPNVVLSAAHCGGAKGRTVYVSGYKYGSTANGAIAVKIVAQKRHPNYNSNTMDNDFFLYKLEREVYPDTDISVLVNTNGNKPSNGQTLRVIGLGLLKENGNAPTYLQDVQVQAVSNNRCNRASSYDGEVNGATMLCAGVSDYSKDSCNGDSGGPLVIENGNEHILVGVVSWGYGCALDGYPGVYSRVSSAVSWIHSVVCDTWNSNGAICGGSNSGGTDNGGNDNGGTDNGTGAGECIALELKFKTDKWPEETSFSLVEENGNYIWDQRDSNFRKNKMYKYNTCVQSNECTRLTFLDSYGDGLLNKGFVRVKYDRNVIYRESDIGYGFTADFGSGC
eukprot:Nitzschia sp. Nitz4//scaffold46_size129759//123241//124846//NITZ4_003527-RA/size129759-augustus-gene-0.29-mRNA-1//-1//CDS//3329552673//533//frame0